MITYVDIYFATLFFITGTVIGSFFNVVIWRVPRGESVVSPPSHCPNCTHEITWYENIPILSYLFLRGKCSGCKTPISLQYPLIELLTGLLSIAAYALFFKQSILSINNWYDSITIAAQYLTIIMFIPITAIDIKHFIIPDSFTYSGLILAFLISFFPGGITPQFSVIGLITGGGILYLTGVLGKLALKKDSMGGGDVKMVAWFGALFGPYVALGTIFIGALIGSIGSGILILLKRTKADEQIPFGPYLCSGTILSLFYGKELWNLYCNIFGLSF